MTSACGPTVPPTEIRRIVETLNGGDAEAAFAACERLLAEAAEDPALDQLAATAALRSGRPEHAARLARRSLAARPDHVATLILLGRTARALGAREEALSVLTRAAERDPQGAEPAFQSCLAAIEAGRPVTSLGLDDLARRFPDEAPTWDEVAQASLARAERVAALFCLTVAFRAAPRFERAMRRALLARELGFAAEARRALEDALGLRPESARAWFLLGITAQDRHNGEAAEAAYRRSLALDPGLAEAAVNLGTLLQERGDIDGAKVAYARGVAARADSFGRVAQALATSPRGELWLDLARLRRHLGG